MKNEEFKSVGIRLSEEELNAVAGGDGNNGAFLYQVQPRENDLSVLALKFGTTKEEICRLNPGLNDLILRSYSWILIPKKS